MTPDIFTLVWSLTLYQNQFLGATEQSRSDSLPFLTLRYERRNRVSHFTLHPSLSSSLNNHFEKQKMKTKTTCLNAVTLWSVTHGKEPGPLANRQ